LSGIAPYEEDDRSNAAKGPVVEKIDTKLPPKVIITAWKCRECQFINNFEETVNGQCGNNKKCNFNIQLEEDITQCMVEIDEQELKN
jgi:hypothetical protein